MQEAAGWLGSSMASVNRRWELAVDAFLAGLSSTSQRFHAGGQAARTLD
jgi:hypothetical protein